MNTTVRVIYHGRVQGVMFRKTTEGIARGFSVSGYVCNLPDGSVELVAQGELDEVNRFLQTVGAEFAGNIRDIERTNLDSDETWADFRVRY
jgi:acylphosphatase